MSLRPCSGCGRHVRTTETSCPFCACALQVAPDAPVRIVGRMGRAAIFAFGAAAAVSSVGCDNGTSAPPDAASMVDTGGPLPADTGPLPDDAGTDAGTDAGNIAPAYGTPTADAGMDGGTAPSPDAGVDAGVDAGGGIGPLYGGPALEDAGQPDAFGGIAPLYGGSPGS